MKIPQPEPTVTPQLRSPITGALEPTATPSASITVADHRSAKTDTFPNKLSLPMPSLIEFPEPGSSTLVQMLI